MKFRVVSIITLCLALLQLGFLVTSGYAALAIKQGDRAADKLVHGNKVSLDLVDSINHLRSVRSMLAASVALNQVGEAEPAQQLLAKARNRFQLSQEAMARYLQADGKSEAELSLQPALQAAYTHYVGQTVRPLVEATARGDAATYARLLAGPASSEDADFEKVLDRSLACRQQSAYQMLHAVHRHAGASLHLQVAAAVLLLWLAVLMRWILVRTVARPLQQAEALADSVTRGELGHTVELVEHSRHEVNSLLRSLAGMDATLVRIVEQVRGGSVEVSAASEQISRGNEDLNQRTQAQAASLEETAATLETMTGNLRAHAAHTRQANVLMGTSRELAVSGDKTSKEAMEAIQSLAASSRRIAEIVNLMDDIAFQTNILALNAAVEAARAGEQGRSFAVVATEVRSLAQRSAEAARQVRTLITEGSHHMEACEVLTRSSNDGLTRIFESVGQMSDIFAEVAAASEEQSEAIAQVNQAVLQMDDNTQQNAALVEEASAAARALHEQAQGLVQQVAFFKIL